MNTGFWITLVIWGIVCGVVGAAIGDLGGKKNGKTGFLLGALLGPIGWIIAAVLPPSERDAQQPANKNDAARIARLEAELAAMKSPRPSKPGTEAKRSKAGDVDERGIPTYKL